MKFVPLALLLVLPVGFATAQERIPDDEAKKIAALLVEAGAKLKAPIKVEIDADKPFAKKKDEHGAMLIPARDLSSQTIANAGNDLVPIGQLWMKGLAPVVGDRVVDSKKLNVVQVTVKDTDVSLLMCWLVVKKGKDGSDLQLLGPDKKPVASLPLDKADDKTELPLEFLASIDGDDRATVTIQVAGKYRAKLKIGKAD